MTRSNKPLLLALTGGIAVCAALLPWSRWLGPATDPHALLGDRAAEYARLRQAEDWVNVYALTDAHDRKAVPLVRFLSLYGRGTLKTKSLVEKSRAVDLPAGTATVTMTLNAELQLDKLPAAMRGSLGRQDPADLVKVTDYTTQWTWADGTWWLRMDPEAVSGVTAEGKAIK
ncbi:MAG: hypothetical protein WAT39_25325 [Planctomycetota bacterium]